jgi:hypothetical protein
MKFGDVGLAYPEHNPFRVMFLIQHREGMGELELDDSFNLEHDGEIGVIVLEDVGDENNWPYAGRALLTHEWRPIDG